MTVFPADQIPRQSERWIYLNAKYAGDSLRGSWLYGVVGAPLSRARRQTADNEIVFDTQGMVTAKNESLLKQ